MSTDIWLYLKIFLCRSNQTILYESVIARGTMTDAYRKFFWHRSVLSFVSYISLFHISVNDLVLLAKPDKTDSECLISWMFHASNPVVVSWSVHIWQNNKLRWWVILTSGWICPYTMEIIWNGWKVKAMSCGIESSWNQHLQLKTRKGIYSLCFLEIVLWIYIYICFRNISILL